ncbi:efflux RND transporter periplasmic adaptor subunit [Mameliella alba]|nr:efflux RND transporter periplasmic adaptor subunit [Antarctobacter heliothermus]MBY6146419.1 efflux RND transporter periplasmic adaptor subunit [Mameliella alba]MCA0955818.1 efflux RND transporter periplasmic adaptor subunit [Mameliella alba]
MKRITELLVALAVLASATYWIFGDSLLPAIVGEGAASVTTGPAPATSGAPGRGSRSATVTLETVQAEPYSLVFEAVGTVEAVSRVAIVSEASGRVDEVLVAPGDQVTAGQPMLRLDQRAQELDLATARAQLAEAADTLDRLQQLSASGSVAVTSVQVKEAQTAVKLAEVAVEIAEFELDQRVVKSPITGAVGLIKANKGDYLSTGIEIATVSKLDALKVGFALPESAVAILEPGLAVDVYLPSRIGQAFAATVSAIDTEIDPDTRLIDVEARLQGDISGLRHGMIANVVLAQEQPPLPAVPALSIAWSREGASVFVVEDGGARRVPVTIRHRLDDRVWVRGELGDGDRIVVEGVQKVREGGQVQTAQARPALSEGADND